MSRLTKEEVAKLPSGVYVKYKCDNTACHRPIMGTMIYQGPDGQDYCSNACYEICEGGVRRSTQRDEKKKGNSMAKDDEEVKKKKAKSEDDAPVKKKKKDADEDEAPKKKKSKKVEEDDADDEEEEEDDEEPKKKKKAPATEIAAGSATNPYKKGSIAFDVFELAKEGTSRKKIERLCEERECASPRLFRELKLEEFRGIKWDYTEEDKGAIKVTLKRKKK